MVSPHFDMIKNMLQTLRNVGLSAVFVHTNLTNGKITKLMLSVKFRNRATVLVLGWVTQPSLWQIL